MNIWSSFLTFIGDIYLSTTPPLMNWDTLRQFVHYGVQGDVILRGFKKKYVDSVFIPNELTHSGILEAHNYVIHSVAEGVERITLADFLIHCDLAMLVRPFYPDGPEKAIEEAIKLIGSDYDFLFANHNDAYYCHELTATCLKAGGVDVEQTKNGILFWEKDIYLAQNLINSGHIIMAFNTKMRKR